MYRLKTLKPWHSQSLLLRIGRVSVVIRNCCYNLRLGVTDLVTWPQALALGATRVIFCIQWPWGMLTPERLWHQKMANTRKALAPEKCWHQKMLRHQKSADTRKVLAPEKCWHQRTWHHPLPVVRKTAFTSISGMHGWDSWPSSDRTCYAEKFHAANHICSFIRAE
jgi:hypothetical protein